MSLAQQIRTATRTLTRLWEPKQLRLWAASQKADKHGMRALLLQQVAIFVLTVRRLRDDEITRRAAALTYYTMLGLVPLMAVAFALFKAFGGLKQAEAPLRELVAQHLAVGSGKAVVTWLDTFVENVSTGALAGVGMLVLFYSVIGLLTNVEKSFNRIWGIRRMRPLHLRLAIYWCVVTLTPPLVGVSLSISAQLRRSVVLTAVTNWLPFGIGRWLLTLSAELSVSIAFVVMYLLIPNTRVKFRCALIGGLVAGLLWSLAKGLFIIATAGATKYSAIYGAFSAIPLMMVWMYYSWLIVLLGVTLSFANQTILTGSFDVDIPRIRYRDLESAGTALVDTVVRCFTANTLPPDRETLVDKTTAPLPVVEALLDDLIKAGIIAEIDENGEKRYVPAKDPRQITPDDIVQAVEARGQQLAHLQSSPATRFLTEAQCHYHERLRQTSMFKLAASDSSTVTESVSSRDIP